MKVTFWNPLAERRGVVVDGLTQEEAEAVLAKVSDPKQPYVYLPDAKIEPEQDQPN